ncbi:ParB/RepB/Spo0J family partition protein [Stutzerimonas kunmingensis]|uniref:ParB/RepB/Spo0J family partition protein n=1 Tax=Stutzerimonas kunmingensis TaxID=1211807 RepID=UPI00241F89CD|nr:ParB N-terminal domain-containing protein [Stutzerimonas kunmingensis]
MSDNIIQCRISLVKVVNRFRKDFGDIDSLAASIAELGLLQPIGVDSSYRLVFGERRLRACQALGWEKIPARTVHLDSILKGELAENEFRKDFTHSERVAIGEAIEAELQGRHGGDRTETKPENFPACPQGDTRDLAAKAAGFGNGKTYEQAKKVTNEAAPELVQAMDEGRASVSAAASLLSLPKEEQAVIATGDKKAIQRASKGAKTRSIELARPDIAEHVLRIINAMDVLARFASSEGLSPNELADRFLEDVDLSQPGIADRLAATLPFMDAIGRIAAELDLEEAA